MWLSNHVNVWYLFQSHILDSFPKKWPRTWLRSAVVIWIVFCLCLCNASICKIHGPPNQRHTRDKYTLRRKNAWRSSISGTLEVNHPSSLFFWKGSFWCKIDRRVTLRIADNSIDLISKFTSFYLLVWRPTVCTLWFFLLLLSWDAKFQDTGWHSKILGREHVGSSPTSLSPDSMVMSDNQAILLCLRGCETVQLVVWCVFGYFRTLDFLFVHVMSGIIGTRKRIRSPMRDEVYTDAHWKMRLNTWWLDHLRAAVVESREARCSGSVQIR